MNLATRLNLLMHEYRVTQFVEGEMVAYPFLICNLCAARIGPLGTVTVHGLAPGKTYLFIFCPRCRRAALPR
jgi:hypothetical protein